MSTCQCQSTLHNHVAGECPNDVEGEGGEKCRSCKEKDNQLRLEALSNLGGDQLVRRLRADRAMTPREDYGR